MNQDQRIPTVSVILTSYNHAKYLRESIDSVLAQTYTDFELVIVDDCSTDESWAIIESYQDERVVKVRHSDCGACFTWVQVVDEAGRPFLDSTEFYGDILTSPIEWLSFFFYKGNALCHPSVLIRRQCFEECGYYRYGLVQLPDFDMWIRRNVELDPGAAPAKPSPYQQSYRRQRI